jgi:hypothetical protein
MVIQFSMDVAALVNFWVETTAEMRLRLVFWLTEWKKKTKIGRRATDPAEFGGSVGVTVCVSPSRCLLLLLA